MTMMTIERKPVDSTAVLSAGYVPDLRTLDIEYANGDVWRYENVPQDIYDKMCEAESPGRFVGQWVLPVFPGTKITAECPKCADKGMNGQRCTDCGCANYGDPEEAVRE